MAELNQMFAQKSPMFALAAVSALALLAFAPSANAATSFGIVCIEDCAQATVESHYGPCGDVTWSCYNYDIRVTVPGESCVEITSWAGFYLSLWCNNYDTPTELNLHYGYHHHTHDFTLHLYQAGTSRSVSWTHYEDASIAAEAAILWAMGGGSGNLGLPVGATLA